MPIQITELSISVSVNQPGGQKSQGPQTQNPDDQDFAENIVDECVEQIMKILDDKKER